jgi:hypothetical protein
MPNLSSWGQLLGESRGVEVVLPRSVDRRAWPRHLFEIDIACNLIEASREVRIPARLRNISSAGAGLVVPHPPQRGSVFGVELPARDGQDRLTLLACVIHATRDPLGEWAVGCQFVNELTSEELKPFGVRCVRSGAPGRRRWVRFPCHVTASFRAVRTAERDYTAVEVLDLSPGGVAILSKRSLPAGTVISLQLLSPDRRFQLRTLACVVRRAVLADGRCCLGCNFIRELSEHEMLALLAPPGVNGMRVPVA